jgi:hypothetical protein
MKGKFFFNTMCVAVMSFCMIGCSQDDSGYFVSSDEEKMLDIVYSRYIILENDQYVLTLSKEDALELGISENCYVKVLTDLERSNAIIAKWIEHAQTDPIVTVVMSNPSGADYSIQFLNGERVITYHDELAVTGIRLKTGGEGDGWTHVSTSVLELGCNPSRNSASATFSQGTTKAKFTLKGPNNMVAWATITLATSSSASPSATYYVSSNSGAIGTQEVSISSYRYWKVTLTDASPSTVKVYKK